MPSDMVEDPSDGSADRMDGSGDTIIERIYGDMHKWHRFCTGASSVLFDSPDAPYFPREIDSSFFGDEEIPADDAAISTDKLPEEIVDTYDIVIQIDELDVDGGANEPIWQHPEMKFGETHEQSAWQALYLETMEHGHPIQSTFRRAMKGRWAVWKQSGLGQPNVNYTWTDWQRDELGQLEFIKQRTNTNEPIERGC